MSIVHQIDPPRSPAIESDSDWFEARPWREWGFRRSASDESHSCLVTPGPDWGAYTIVKRHVLSLRLRSFVFARNDSLPEDNDRAIPAFHYRWSDGRFLVFDFARNGRFLIDDDILDRAMAKEGGIKWGAFRRSESSPAYVVLPRLPGITAPPT